MLARFDRYVLGQLMVSFGFFALIIVVIQWLNQTVGLFSRLIGDGQTVRVFFEYSLLLIPFTLFIFVPLAAFGASLQVANRLSTDSEVVTLRASGISSFRLIRPALVFGVLTCILMLVLIHVLVPAARTQISLRGSQINQDIAAQLLKEGQFLFPASGVTGFIGKVTDDQVLEEVLVSDRRDPEQSVIYTAERAFLVPTSAGPRLIMADGLAQSLSEDGTLSILAFEDFAFDLGELIAPPSTRIGDLRAYPTRTLIERPPELYEFTGKSEAQILAELHARFGRPLLSVTVATLGFAALLIGGFSRFGLWGQIGTAVVLLILVQMTHNAAESAARASANSWPLLYAPAAVAGLFTAALLWLADSPLPTALRRRLTEARTAAP